MKQKLCNEVIGVLNKYNLDYTQSQVTDMLDRWWHQ